MRVMPDASPSKDRATARRGILLYGMYDLRVLDKAPKVRIELMTRALAGRTPTERIVGGRIRRALTGARWLAGGGPRRVRAVYVEAPTSNPMPTDLAFLALMRLLRRPVGVYFRDAYPLFRDVHPRIHRRQIVTDWLWRLTTPMLKSVATVRFAPSAGLARALGLSNAVMLPPGTDPTLPDLGIGDADRVATIAQATAGSGLDTLVEAMALIRERRPEATLRVVTRSVRSEPAAGLPDWVELVPASRDSMADLLRPARVCVLPLPINRYTNMAVAVRLLDLLGFGKPVVATDTDESRALIAASRAGKTARDDAAGLAEAVLPILENERLARRLAANARAYARSPEATWDARARTVLDALGLADGAGA
jgi:glycosyltransferase involved in cell wall biosynthesis